MSRRGKSIEIETQFVATGEWEVAANAYGVSLKVMIIFRNSYF